MKNYFFPIALVLIFGSCSNPSSTDSDIESESTEVEDHSPRSKFVHIQKVIPGLKVEARYHSDNNFVGTIVDGYQSDSLMLTREAATALAKVQKALKPRGFELKIFDSYRPQRAVDHFVRWAEDLEDTLHKRTYYPDVDKSELFDKGYIAAKSGHTRGSTVDLTIIFTRTKEELDMGTPFDYFSPKSWPSDTTVSDLQYNNRMMLQQVMEDNGFKHLKEEWWHFTLKNEPFPTTYFDFVVK